MFILCVKQSPKFSDFEVFQVMDFWSKGCSTTYVSHVSEVKCLTPTSVYQIGRMSVGWLVCPATDLQVISVIQLCSRESTDPRETLTPLCGGSTVLLSVRKARFSMTVQGIRFHYCRVIVSSKPRQHASLSQ